MVGPHTFADTVNNTVIVELEFKSIVMVATTVILEPMRTMNENII